ncbi:hypothetical protein [Granulicella sp. dw_53]|uniref:hypothetical protein n=1 Tax=Granulicella sp. dw_53 TaxID=2719792 RepID=UPI001BD61A68|nr:hypothetical protein [Granulicella sp. dw_53]
MESRAYRDDLLKSMISHATESYKEMVRVMAVIEDKAQKVAALSGVFLAAGFGFIKQENLRADSPLGGFWTLLLLACAIFILTVAVGLCLWVLWVREQVAPMEVFRRMESSILKRPVTSMTDELQEGSRVSSDRLWDKMLDRQQKMNQKKASILRWAQTLLTVAMGLVATALLLVLVENLCVRVIASVVGLFAR